MLIAGCGGGSAGSGLAQIKSSTTSSNASGTSSANANALAFSQCMRSHGVPNYPDPTSNGRPQSLNGIDPSAAAVQRAYTACRKYAANGEAGPPAPSVAQLRRALTFAGCMRKHGLPQFPDPLTTYGPGFTLGQGEYFPDIPGTMVQSPAFTQAAKACGVPLS